MDHSVNYMEKTCKLYLNAFMIFIVLLYRDATVPIYCRRGLPQYIAEVDCLKDPTLVDSYHQANLPVGAILTQCMYICLRTGNSIYLESNLNCDGSYLCIVNFKIFTCIPGIHWRR